jgi:autotransporter-associated beta strand protein
MKICHWLSVLLIVVGVNLVQAGSATWNVSPGSGDWNTATNWTPATVPNGPSDVATFGRSSITAISISTDVEVKQIVFSPGASAYTIAPANDMADLTLDAPGIANNSGIVQQFGGDTKFNSAGVILQMGSTAGNLIAFSPAVSLYCWGDLGTASVTSTYGGQSSYIFENAAQATFDVGNALFFQLFATADDGNFLIRGSLPDGTPGGVVVFDTGTSAVNATFTLEGGQFASQSGGFLTFTGTAAAANATIIANGGVTGSIVYFSDTSTGDNASITLSGNATLDVSFHRTAAIGVGSLAGSGGNVIIGSRNLSVGGNPADTRFSGIIQDGSNDTGGAITKIGSGTLILSGANTYTGGTIVKGGTLLVSNRSGSGTGSGPLQVTVGTLGGRGSIAGAVTIGSGSGSQVFLAPSANSVKPVSLTTLGALTFQANATYSWKLNTKRMSADLVNGNGVAINHSASFAIATIGNKALPAGQVFLAINNSSATSIAGTFANLPDGGTIAFGNNTFQANYEGGDGNDLTLSVVP